MNLSFLTRPLKRTQKLTTELFGALTFSALTLSALTLSALTLSAVGCDDGLKETKSSSISFEPTNISFAPLERGQTYRDEILKVRHGGEAPLTVTNIYLAKYEFGELVEIEGCDRVTEGVENTQILTPDVLPTCNLLITERPELPVTLDNNNFEQVMLTFRPLLDQPDLGNVSLIVESDANGMFVEEIPLTVSSSSPQINGDRVIEFASTGTNTANYLVRNEGGGRLIVTNVRIERNEGSPAFVDASGMEQSEFSWDSTCFPCTLDMAENPYMSIQVTYTPGDDQGPDKATMFIDSTTEAGEPLGTMEVLLTTESTPRTLTINPNPIVFEPLPNQEDSVLVSFVNNGLSNLNVLGVTFEPEQGPFSARGEQTSFAIPGGGIYELNVMSAAGASGVGTMVVRTDAENAEGGELRVPISVGGGDALPLLEASVSSLTFDGVAPEESAEASFTLTSNGTTPVTISAVRFEGDEVFELVSGGEAGALNAGESREVVVKFTRPSAAPGAPLNTYAATLKVESDSLGGDVDVTLSAAP